MVWLWALERVYEVSGKQRLEKTFFVWFEQLQLKCGAEVKC